MPLELSTEETFLVRQAAVRLQNQFHGKLNTETVERFMTDSLDHLLQKATTTTWIVLLAERFAAAATAGRGASADQSHHPEPERPFPVRAQRRTIPDGGRVHARFVRRNGGRLHRRVGACR